MASNNTQVRAKNGKGNELHVSHSQTDSPILDVVSLERLQQFRPDIVDFVITQTAAEAEYRRKESCRINTFTFIEHLGGILLAATVCCGGIFGSVWAANEGHENLAIVIAVCCIGTLAVAYLNRTKNNT